MKILFIHRSYPSQFKFPAIALSVVPGNEVMFITNDKTTELHGIKKYTYDVFQKPIKNENPYLDINEEAIAHGLAVADVARAIKKDGIIPDLIVAHSWGTALFIKDVFPDVPLICYFEWFANALAEGSDDSDSVFKQNVISRIGNFETLSDLCSCDGAMAPTQWQKSQFPKEFQDKIKVIHDGIDTVTFKPDDEATFFVKDKNLTLSKSDEVITYATRGFEPTRGFPQFMTAVEKLLKSRPNAHFVIAGEDNVNYGEKLKNGSYKQLMLEKLDIDLNRVHFVGWLQHAEYLKLLQISSAHVYLTTPIFLSWSFLESMSTGCCIISSKTGPVMEVMQDSHNGLLVDLNNIEELVEKVQYALENVDEMQTIRANARQTILDKYSMEVCLSDQIRYYFSLLT